MATRHHSTVSYSRDLCIVQHQLIDHSAYTARFTSGLHAQNPYQPSRPWRVGSAIVTQCNCVTLSVVKRQRNSSVLKQSRTGRVFRGCAIISSHGRPQARFYVGAGAIASPNLSLAPTKSLVTAAVCSSKTCKQLYRGVFGGLV